MYNLQIICTQEKISVLVGNTNTNQKRKVPNFWRLNAIDAQPNTYTHTHTTHTHNSSVLSCVCSFIPRLTCRNSISFSLWCHSSILIPCTKTLSTTNRLWLSLNLYICKIWFAWKFPCTFLLFFFYPIAFVELPCNDTDSGSHNISVVHHTDKIFRHYTLGDMRPCENGHVLLSVDT